MSRIAAAAVCAVLSVGVVLGWQERRGTTVAGPWRFVRGLPGESLHAIDVRSPDDSAEAVALPHRLALPNTALWYARELNLPAGGALDIDADDGAQVFVDGRQVPGAGRLFAIPEALAGSRLVTVRVLNNAVAGGLRAVRLLDAAGARDALVGEPLPVVPVAIPPVEAPAFLARMPGADRPCRFALWGDSQGGWRTFDRLVRAMAAERFDVAVGAGDLVDDGASPRAWRAFLETLAPLAAVTPVVPVAGNHDYDGRYDTLRADHYLSLMRPDGRPFFAWSCGPVRFMAIDINTEFPLGIAENSLQGRWMAAEASSQAWREAAWRVLVVHQPPWSRSWSGYEGDEAVREWVRRLMASDGSTVNLVVSGHSHAYERLARTVDGRRVHGLVTGGAGGALEDASAERLDDVGGDRVVVRHHFVRARATARLLSWEAVDIDGAVFDRHVLARP